MGLVATTEVEEKKDEEQSQGWTVPTIDIDKLDTQYKWSEPQEESPPPTQNEKPPVVEETPPTAKEEKENAVLAWTRNTFTEAGRYIFQEIGADDLGLLTHEGGFGKGDNYWNDFVNPNSSKNTGELVRTGPTVEEDQTWLRLSNGDTYSLTTGRLFPKHLLIENDQDLLKDDAPFLSTIERSFGNLTNTEEKKSVEELTEIMNTKGSGATIVQHPALTRSQAIKAALAEHNKNNPNNMLGPTGDFGMHKDRKLAGVSKLFTNTERGTWEQGELENLEGVAGTAIGMIVPIVIEAWALQRVSGSALKPWSTKLEKLAHGGTPLFTTAITKNVPGKLKTLGARFVKGSTEYALVGAHVASMAESEVSAKDQARWEERHGRPMENRDRRIFNRNRDMFIYGPSFGFAGELAGPALGTAVKQIGKTPNLLKSLPNRVIKKVDELGEKIGDLIADLDFEERVSTNEQKAIDLANKGPSAEIKKDDVIPTKRVTGTKTVETKDLIEEKGTQKELDIQKEEATQARIKAEEQSNKSAKALVDASTDLKPKDLEGPRTIAEELEGVDLEQLSETELLDIIQRITEDPKKAAILEAQGISKKDLDDFVQEQRRLQPVDSDTVPPVGTDIPRGEVAQTGAVFIERTDRTGDAISGLFNLPRTYEIVVLQLDELEPKQLKELGIKRGDIKNLSARQTINLLKKNFDKVRETLIPGEYRLEGYSDSRRKLFKKWFQNDPDVIWVDRISGEKISINDEDAIPYLVVKETKKVPSTRSKLQPGDPHPTDKNKVRGYNNRWVTKKYFDKVTKSRAGADKIIKDVEAEGKARAEETIRKIEEDVQKKVDSMTDEEITADLKKDPKYKDIIEEYEELRARTDKHLKKSKEAIDRIESLTDIADEMDQMFKEIDDEMARLDMEIQPLDESDAKRISLERIYQGLDAQRQEIKIEKKNQLERVPDEIGGASESIESPILNRPKFGFEIRGAKPAYRQMKIEFESDIDRAIYIVTKRRSGYGPAKDRPLYVEQSNKNASAANHLYLKFLYDFGFDDALILKHAPRIYDTLAKNYSANGVYSFKDTGAWKDGSDFKLEATEEDPDFYNPERGLDEVTRKQAEEYVRKYKEATSPKDPNTAEKLLRDEDMQLEAGPELPDIEPIKGVKGKKWEDILVSKGFTREEARGFVLFEMDKVFEEFEKEIFRIGGPDVGLEFRKIFEHARTGKQISAYGLEGTKAKVGDKIQARGGYSARRDLIVMAMIYDGDYVQFSRGLKTAWHEAFHRLQDKFFTKAEIKVLNNAAPKLRQIVREAYPDLSDKFIKNLGNNELQAFAFGAWSDPKIRAKYQKGATWAKPFEKVAEILESLIKILRKDYRTWDELFDAASKGEIAERGRNGGLGLQTDDGFMLEMDPDEFVDQVRKTTDAVDSGEIKIEDLMGETGEDAAEMARRLRSRSGKTEYIPRSEKDLIIANATFEQILTIAQGDKAARTGLPKLSMVELKRLGSREVERLGLDPAETIRWHERALKGDRQSQEDLVSLAGLIWHRDVNLKTLTENAVEYQGTKGTDQIKSAQKLMATLEDQVKLDIALERVSRNWGQTGNVLQQGFGDYKAQVLAEGTILRQTVSEETTNSAIKGGFTAVDGPAGKGVYFSTEQAAGPKGSVELYGELRDDMQVLDLVSSNKTLIDLAKEVKLPGIDNLKKGQPLNAAQQKALEEIVREKGYIGIRYSTEFIKDAKTGDQVVIYANNAANRIIDSDAAIPPERLQEGSVGSLVAEAFDGVENLLSKKLKPSIQEALQKGELTTEAREVMDGLAALAYQLNDGQRAGTNLLSLMDRVPDGKLDRNTVWNVFRNLIFLRASTFLKVFGGSSYRMLTLPFTTYLGEMKQRKGMSPAELKVSDERLKMIWGMYPKMVKQLPYAFEMMWAAMRHNEVMVNLGRGYLEGSTNRYMGGNKQLELDFDTQRVTKELTGQEWWLDGNNNPLSIMQHYLTEFHTTGASRVMSGFDSFHAAMIGPTTEYFRFYDLELQSQLSKGVEGPKAHNIAHDNATKRLQKAMQDVDLADGKVIKNGRLSGSHVKKTMDWVNFTDDIRIGKGGQSPVEFRTYEYGVQKARTMGKTDPREIVEFATAWANEIPGDQFAKMSDFQEGMQWTVNAPGRGWQQMMNNAPLIAYPMQAVNRTPVNIVKSAQRSIPGLNKYVDSYWRDVNSEDWVTRSRALGEVSTAQVLLGMGVMLNTTGMIRINGFRPTSQDDQLEWNELGKEPLTIQVYNAFTGKYTGGIPLDFLDGPANIWGAIGSYNDNYQKMRQKDNETFFALTAVTAIAPTVWHLTLGQTDKSTMNGFRKLFSLVQEMGSGTVAKDIKGDQSAFERYVIKLLTGSGALGGPGYIKDSRNAIDPLQRDIDPSRIDTFLPEEADVILRGFENAFNTWKNGIPYLSQSNPPILHSLRGYPLQVRRVPFDSGISADDPIIKLANSQGPLAAFKGRVPSTDPVDEERLRLRGNGSDGSFRIWNRRIFNLPDYVLNRSEINRLTVIGTQEVKLLYPPASGRQRPSVSLDRYIPESGRGKLLAQESENGLTLNEALTRLISSPEYQALPRTALGNNRSERSDRWWEIIDVYKEFAKDKFTVEMDQGNSTLGKMIKDQLMKDNNQPPSYDRFNPSTRKFLQAF